MGGKFLKNKLYFFCSVREIILVNGQNYAVQCFSIYLSIYPSIHPFIHPSISLVKLHYFQFAFLENCVYKKQKKSIKDQRNLCSNTFFNVFINFVSAHSKIWCSCFFYEQNDINFFIPLVGDLPEIDECLYLTPTMECNSFQI